MQQNELTDLKISAIIPVYNGRKYLREAVESVIAQTLPPVELILVDDGSTDDSLDVIADLKAPFPIQIIRQPNAGQSAARNHGVKVSEGDYIALLDQDDAWYPEHLKKLAEPFLSGKRLGWVYSNLDIIDGKQRVITHGLLNFTRARHPKHQIEEMIGEDIHILPSASLINKEAFLGIGGFDERLCGYEDDDLFRRLFETRWQHVYLPESLSFWRIYGGSTSYSPRMAVSRKIYANKLCSEYPDEPALNRYWRHALIAPRFFKIALDQYRIALNAREYAACGQGFMQIGDFYKLLSKRARIKWLPAMIIMRFPRLCRLSEILLRACLPLRVLKRLVS